MHLIWAALFRRKVRTIFTLLSVLAAFLLFGLLDSVRSAFAGAGVGTPGATRLVTTSKLGYAALPQSLYADIQAVPGVVKVSYSSGFPVIYQDPKNSIFVEATEEHQYDPDIYPEWHIPTAYRGAFRTTRAGALAGETLAKKYNWKVGDKIPLQARLPQKNGSTTWTFDLVGIYRIDNPTLKMFEGNLLINWDYFDEARQSENGTVIGFIIKVADLNQVDRVAKAIDALSANSDHETKTRSENAFLVGWGKQFANIGLIVGAIMGAVFFTLVLLTGNVMAQAVRERIPEMAVLKTLGFTGRSVMGLILGESALLLLLGSALGLALSAVAVGVVRLKLGPAVPMLPVGGAIWLRGLTLAVTIGLVVGALPAWRGMRLRIVDALSGR